MIPEYGLRDREGADSVASAVARDLLDLECRTTRKHCMCVSSQMSKCLLCR